MTFCAINSRCGHTFILDNYKTRLHLDDADPILGAVLRPTEGVRSPLSIKSISRSLTRVRPGFRRRARAPHVCKGDARASFGFFFSPQSPAREQSSNKKWNSFLPRKAATSHKHLQCPCVCMRNSVISFFLPSSSEPLRQPKSAFSSLSGDIEHRIFVYNEKAGRDRGSGHRILFFRLLGGLRKGSEA